MKEEEGGDLHFWECESESRLSFGTFLLFGESLSVLD